MNIIDKNLKKLLRRIKSALEVGSVEKFRRARWRYLTSPAAKFCAAKQALLKVGVHQPTDEAIRALAAQITVYRANHELVFARAIAKPSGGTRNVCSFGLRSRAVQYLLKPLLEVCGVAKGHQYGFCGRSRDDLARFVKENIESGYAYAVLLDIADCFGSFDGDAVAGRLPLPRQVVESNMTFHRLEMRTRSRRSRLRRIRPSAGVAPLRVSPSSPGALRTMSLGGIPQGSAVSNLVAACLLADLIDVVPDGIPFGQYGDDIIALAKTEEEACTIRDALCGALEGHQAGSMVLKRSEVSEIADGFDFLGYSFFGSVEDIHITPSAQNMAKFRSRWRAAVLRDYQLGRYRAYEARQVAYNLVRGFGAATGLRGVPAAATFKANHYLLICQTQKRKPSSSLNPLTPIRIADP